MGEWLGIGALVSWSDSFYSSLVGDRSSDDKQPPLRLGFVGEEEIKSVCVVLPATG